MLRLSIAITAIWFICVLLYGYKVLYSPTNFQLNALGDWLAGALSPVALAWFVAAFLLQRKDLQKNSEAVELQREEIKAATEIAREQLTAQIAKERPLLLVEGASIKVDDEDGEPRLVLTVRNIGGKNAAGIETSGYDGEDTVYQTPLWFRVASASEGFVWLHISLSRSDRVTNYSIDYCATANLREERNHRHAVGDSYEFYVTVTESVTGYVRIDSGTFRQVLELPVTARG